MHHRLRSAHIVAAILLVLPASVRAQSLLDRSPNLSGDWTGAPGTLYFHFVHRFSTSGGPERKVSNVPTFLVAAGLPKHFLAGINYSTNSALSPRFPNEWELFARWAPLSQDYGAPLDLGGQVGYNNAASGVDGEVSVARRFGPARLIVAGRALSDPLKSGNVRYAFAGGGTFRLGTYVALAGDIASLTQRDSSEHIAWSAGLHFAIPLTPHTVSFQVTNTLVTTLQGVSRGTKNRRYGFEFTIPLTLRRYFGRHDQPTAEPTDSTAASASVAGDSIASSVSPPASALSSTNVPLAVVPTPAATPPPTSPPVRTPAAGLPRAAPKPVHNGMKIINYLNSRLRVPVGTTVEWTNNDPVAHTVTSVDKSFNSGLINPGKTYRHTFTKAGTYNYSCTTHPFMKGVVAVTEN